MKIVGYLCGGEKTKRKKEKRKKKGNVWVKESKRMRNDHLKILLQYFHNKF